MEHLAIPYKVIDRHGVILAARFTTGCLLGLELDIPGQERLDLLKGLSERPAAR
jgi:hypothetical protein